MFLVGTEMINVAFELLKMLTSEEEMAVIKKAMGF